MYHAFIAAFAGTTVEFFETVAISYALIRAGYVREAIAAVLIGHLAVFGTAFLLVPVQAVMPVAWLHLGAALLLTGMGGYWTVKSARRLLAHRRPHWVDAPLESVGVATPGGVGQAFSIVVFVVILKTASIEAAEILLVVFPAAAATGAWGQAMAGVLAGIILVTSLAVVLHGHLKAIPEVKLKLAIGLILLGIGLWWLAEAALAHPF